MSIPTRRIDESLLIGEDIEVLVLEVRGSQVRLGVQAPADVKVLRDELVDDDEVT